jgi:hypothetical protein
MKWKCAEFVRQSFQCRAEELTWGRERAEMTEFVAHAARQELSRNTRYAQNDLLWGEIMKVLPHFPLLLFSAKDFFVSLTYAVCALVSMARWIYVLTISQWFQWPFRKEVDRMSILILVSIFPNNRRHNTTNRRNRSMLSVLSEPSHMMKDENELTTRAKHCMCFPLRRGGMLSLYEDYWRLSADTTCTPTSLTAVVLGLFLRLLVLTPLPLCHWCSGLMAIQRTCWRCGRRRCVFRASWRTTRQRNQARQCPLGGVLEFMASSTPRGHPQNRL